MAWGLLPVHYKSKRGETNARLPFGGCRLAWGLLPVHYKSKRGETNARLPFTGKEKRPHYSGAFRWLLLCVRRQAYVFRLCFYALAVFINRSTLYAHFLGDSVKGKTAQPIGQKAVFVGA